MKLSKATPACAVPRNARSPTWALAYGRPRFRAAQAASNPTPASSSFSASFAASLGESARQ